MALSLFSTKFNKNLAPHLRPGISILRRYCATQNAIVQSTENTAKVEYPPILDQSKKAVADREKIAWHEQVKKCLTIEEKLIKVNMPAYWGLRTIPLVNDEYHYNCFPYFQHWTRTQYETGLPSGWFKSSTEKVDGLVNSIREQIIEAISFQYQGLSREYESDANTSDEEKNRLRTAEICKDLHRIINKSLHSVAPHLMDSEVDIESRHEAFWMVGGIEPPKDKKIWLDRKPKLTEEELNEPVDRPFQYVGMSKSIRNPILSMRNRLPLEPVIDNFENETFDVEEIPKSRCDPQALGYQRVYQHVRTIPGFWPGSEHEFGQLCYHNRHKYKVSYNESDLTDQKNALKAQAILNSFGWLIGQAYYQGFSTFNELTYPLTTQTIITDGQNWSFYVYQLNTTVFETVYFDRNRRSNKCWGTDELKLFEKIDENGQVIGFNDEVLRYLIQFYLAEPKQREYNMKPYLGTDEQTIADIDHVERRDFLEQNYKHLMSGKPRHRKDLMPEVYMWEWIYKIKFDTRPMDARRRFFELNQDPWDRRLDDYHPLYIPRNQRIGGYHDKKNKWRAKYWP